MVSSASVSALTLTDGGTANQDESLTELPT
jgi:hypothetical protein